MAIDAAALAMWKFAEHKHTYTRRDTILYALGIGLGVPATDPNQLAFVYEEGLRAVPTMAVILGYRGFWAQDPATGIDWQRVLHSGQSITLHAPLPVEGTVLSRQRVTALIDKGGDKGALLTTERDIFDEEGEILLAQVEQTNLLRGDGGFGRSFGSTRPLDRIPERAPDLSIDLPTLEQAALLYRLCGDFNPLHADPKIAASAGFARPILHGLCTFGVMARAVLATCAGWSPDRICGLRGRFAAPVYPGETIRTDMWLDGTSGVWLKGLTVERNTVVFDHGYAQLSAMPSEPWRDDCWA